MLFGWNQFEQLCLRALACTAPLMQSIRLTSIRRGRLTPGTRNLEGTWDIVSSGVFS
jgi:hypothetical protein